jgi:HPt (histidine-containing phosphotransfer) domain-containing protein
VSDFSEIHKQGPVIDVAHLQRMACDDKNLMIEVLGIFRQQADMWEKLLSPDTPTPDFMVAAHTIKGSAKSIGAWELGEICGRAEEEARTRQLSRDEKFMWREQILQTLGVTTAEVAQVEHKLNMELLKG